MPSLHAGGRDPMTDWVPDLSARSGPTYRAIADALADDIGTGALPSGTRLPTHRELAWRLGVTVGTVTRAYAEAMRDGLVTGEVGRGTYVRQPSHAADDFIKDVSGQTERGGPINLTIARPPSVAEDRWIAEAMAEVAADPAVFRHFGYQPQAGADEHRDAAADWMANRGLPPTPERIAVTAGAHHGILVVLAALTRPGDRVLCETMSYPGFHAAARLLGLRLEPIAADADGIDPDALDAAARGGDAKALYCVPTLQNPTAASMSAARRVAIVEVARRHGLPIVEDDIFSSFAPDGPPPLALHAPELCYFVTSLSKTIAPGLRVGYLIAPPGRLDPVAHATYASCVMATPLTVAIATRLINSGKAARLVQARVRESGARAALVRDMLGPWGVAAPQATMHGWLPLPAGWTPESFCEAARRRGAKVTPAEVFAIRSEDAPCGVRICTGGSRDLATLERALSSLRDVLHEAPRPAPISYDGMI